MRLLVTLGLCVAALTFPSTSTSAEGATPPCQGERATLVGHPGKRKLVGTDGRDVIVSNGAREVLGEGGDDLICVTGTTWSVTTPTGPTSRAGR
jgi:hypothetical protein